MKLLFEVVVRVGWSYLGLAEVLGNDVGTDFAPLNDITTVLCVSTHGSSSVSLVEAAANILGCELEVAVFAHAEDLCGPHGRVIPLSQNVKIGREDQFAPLGGLVVGNRRLEGELGVDVSYGGLRIEFLEMRLFGTRRSSDAGG
jgi:hypothetical protein